MALAVGVTRDTFFAILTKANIYAPPPSSGGHKGSKQVYLVVSKLT